MLLFKQHPFFYALGSIIKGLFRELRSYLFQGGSFFDREANLGVVMPRGILWGNSVTEFHWN